MASFLENIIKEDTEFLMKALQNDGKQLKEKLDSLILEFESSHLHGIDKQMVSSKSERLRKGVLSDITENNALEVPGNFKIKIERASFIQPVTPLGVASEGENNSNSHSLVNSNPENEMPAPKSLPPRKKKIKTEPLDMPKRSTRTRKRPTKYSDSGNSCDGKPSDVMIQNATIITVDITSGSDNESENIKENVKDAVVRSTRARQNKKAKMDFTKTNGGKEQLTPENNTVEQINNNEVVTTSESTETETNATFTVTKQPTIMDCTVVIEKSDIVKDASNKNVDTVSKIPSKQRNKKEVFSPYDKMSTRLKVDAFEKLTANKNISVQSPPRKVNRIVHVEEQNGIVSKQRTFTPLAAKLTPKVHSTTKVNRIIMRQESSSSNNSLLSSKSQSALKASQAEFREREKRRQEKEREALKKREALMLALTEEKRRKREEKQLKARQQREMLEKEKQKIVEIQKQKKTNKDIMDKEEKLQMQKDEDDKKHLSKMKAAERKYLPESHKVQKLPLYMTSEAPLLPTDDCYDSDEEEQDRTRRIPNWSTERELKKTQLVLLKIGEEIKNTFFSRQTYTPDLQEIFEHIDPRKLKRTSSAVWRKPPRYTFFLESSTVHFSEDDE